LIPWFTETKWNDVTLATNTNDIDHIISKTDVNN
jgi:hypothetical protein